MTTSTRTGISPGPLSASKIDTMAERINHILPERNPMSWLKNALKQHSTQEIEIAIAKVLSDLCGERWTCQIGSMVYEDSTFPSAKVEMTVSRKFESTVIISGVEPFERSGKWLIGKNKQPNGSYEYCWSGQGWTNAIAEGKTFLSKDQAQEYIDSEDGLRLC